MTTPDALLRQVHGFWNTEACETGVVENALNEADFFERFREQRYRNQWHIPLLVPFADARGKKVLEIGVGNGADGVLFAANGASYTGVDLTEAALEATRKHFQVLGLAGAVQRDNAEHLSFADDTFDIVYSYGVLHHTPDIQRAIDEAWRVLKPGGRAIVMLYHKTSFNYYVRIMSYMRLRVLLEILRHVGRHEADRERLRGSDLIGLRGNRDRRLWEVHYRNFLRQGWTYLRASNFVHHCTDGPECPVARAFSKRDARRLFARFSIREMRVAHFPLKKYWTPIPLTLEKHVASRLGWYLLIYADKPRQWS